MTGLRVVELCDEKGAFAGKLVADMGAEVIKVEPPGGDPTRGYAPFAEDRPGPERSLWFWHYNTSKRGVTLNIDHEAGRDVLLRLRRPQAAAGARRRQPGLPDRLPLRGDGGAGGVAPSAAHGPGAAH